MTDALRIVVVGGVAGGATACARISRVNADIHVHMFERTSTVSFANCGLPYYIGNEIKDRNDLLLHTPKSLQTFLGPKSRISVNSEVVGIDRKEKTITVLSNGTTSSVPYDKLILSMGASPIVPPPFRINDNRIFTLRTMNDADRMKGLLASPNCKRIAVVGAGFIGIELVEQIHGLKKEVVLIEMKPTILPIADTEIALTLERNMRKQKGLTVLTETSVTSVIPGPSSLTVTLTNAAEKKTKTIEVDALVVCVSVHPDTTFVVKSDITVNDRGFISVNEFMQTNDPNIYAVGDCVETADYVFPERRTVALLGNVANIQARIAADHAATGKSIPYKGSLGTCIVRAFGMSLAMTGWTESRLRQSKIAYKSNLITANDSAGYYPGSTLLTVKILYDPSSLRILGGQAVGAKGADKRVDVISAAIVGKLTINDLSQIQLSYNPIAGAARDPINLVGLIARNVEEGYLRNRITVPRPEENKVLVDVRPASAFKAMPLPGAVNIPLDTLDKVIPTLDKSKEYVTSCRVGKTAYFASRKMTAAGIKTEQLVGGIIVQAPVKPESKL
eukprot:PhF_6_TR14966/c0_g1_i3/m.23497